MLEMEESVRKIQATAEPIKRFFASSGLPRIILIIIGILVLLSLIARSCKCSEEGFEGVRTVDSYLPNYVIDVQRRCLPGEVDSDRWCIKSGCPAGMERGTGSGSELCYPKCLDGYDSNGMSRCYKKCPEGFQANETTCTNPEHTFKKDVVPCKGCIDNLPLLRQNTLQGKLPVPIVHPSAPVIMSPNSSVQGCRVTNLVPEAVIWTSFVEEFDGAAGPAKATGGGGGGGGSPATFNGKSQASPASPIISDVQTIPLPALANPGKGPSIATVQLGAMANPANAANYDRPPATQTTQTTPALKNPAPAANIATKVTVNLSEPRIDHPMYPCPRGYTLSGDKCFENCPPTYRDTNDGQCVRASYTIDRDSYDRGSGVPYVTRRPKYEQIFHS